MTRNRLKPLFKLTLPCLTIRQVSSRSIGQSTPWTRSLSFSNISFGNVLVKLSAHSFFCADKEYFYVVLLNILHKVPVFDVDVLGAWAIFFTFGQFYSAIVIFKHSAMNLGHA